MAIDDLVKEILMTAKRDLWDRPDEWIREKYQGFRKSCERVVEEDAFIPAYLLAVEAPLVPFFMTHHYNKEEALLLSAYGIVMSSLLVISLPYLFFHHNSHTIQKNQETVENPLFAMYHRFACAVRYPLFLATGAILSYSFFNHSSSIIHGLQGLSVVSGLYFVDRDPKLLDKDPFWKRMYQWTMEKIDGLLPQPSPQPVPVQVRYAVQPVPS